MDTFFIDPDIAEELLDPEYHLLVAFKAHAPGTYIHCEKVRDLCEKIGRALKLNVDICKLIGMYHDIGKMWAPEYFCENQSKTFNIHDNMDPYISYQMITNHVAAGAAILTTQCQKMPVEMIRIMSMHHGNSVLKPMFAKVQETSKFSEEDFRYKYDKPDNVYSGILMISDTIEAALKSMTQQGILTEENTPVKINEIITGMTAAEQLDKMTIEQVRTAGEVLMGEFAVTNKRVGDGYDKELNISTGSPSVSGNNTGKKKKV